MARFSDKPDEPKTSRPARLLETARAFGCDEDEAAFDEKLKGITGQKAKPYGGNNARSEAGLRKPEKSAADSRTRGG